MRRYLRFWVERHVLGFVFHSKRSVIEFHRRGSSDFINDTLKVNWAPSGFENDEFNQRRKKVDWISSLELHRMTPSLSMTLINWNVGINTALTRVFSHLLGIVLADRMIEKRVRVRRISSAYDEVKLKAICRRESVITSCVMHINQFIG